MYEQMGIEMEFFQDTCCGKMLREQEPVQVGKTSDAFLKRLQKSRTKTFQFLCQAVENGQKLDALSVMDLALRGELLMHNISFHNEEEESHCWQTLTDTQLQTLSSAFNCNEYPNNPVDCHLSDVLEEEVDEKYNLSVRAAKGILERANKRDKTLPQELKDALEYTINNEKS